MSRKPRRVPERIQDMLEAIGHIESDLGDLSRDEFLTDGKTQRAVIESLIVIGEAGNKITQLDPTLKDSAPELWQQFRDAYDMRIILTHEYFRVDAGVVWTTIQDNLPLLKAQLTGFLSQYSPAD
ncbi:MAG: DUF86 domain-containing protein [Oceanospirillaceae bacterium]|nr:DUF86 domain-containing protein [Oceanospirillaceae bacterium]